MEKLVAVGKREERGERRGEQAKGEFRMMEDVEGGEVKRRGINCSYRTVCSERRRSGHGKLTVGEVSSDSYEVEH